jgi:hypothetical protein
MGQFRSEPDGIELIGLDVWLEAAVPLLESGDRFR